MERIDQLCIAGINLAFEGTDISNVLKDKSFYPFSSGEESFLSIPVLIADRTPEAVCVGPMHVYDRTKVFLSEDYEHAYIIGRVQMDRLLLSKCLSFLMCMLLTAHHGLILHSSVVSCEGQAILFSGDSGCGKSTQAKLWSSFANAHILNHDKALIRFDHRWLVYGSPWSGENHCYINRFATIKALVFLAHGETNELIKVDTKQAISFIFPQLRFFFEQAGVIDDLMTTVERLLAEIPVYFYRCLPDQSAVWHLHSYLSLKGDLNCEN